MLNKSDHSWISNASYLSLVHQMILLSPSNVHFHTIIAVGASEQFKLFHLTKELPFYFKFLFCSDCCMIFFWVISRRLNFICRRFGTLCLFHLHRQVGVEWLGFQAKPSQSVNRGTSTCAKRNSTSPCLLVIPAFDRIAGLYNRHLNLKGKYANANDFEVRLRALTGFAKDWCLCGVN